MRGTLGAIGAAAVMLAAVPAEAQSPSISVATFLSKVTALKAKGAMALFSSDVGLLKRESALAVQSLQADKAARKAAGKAPLYCPPEGQKKMAANEMIAGLNAIPAAQRGINLKDGFLRVLATKYPCR